MEAIEHDRCDKEVTSMVNRHHAGYLDRQRFRVIAETQNAVLMEHVERESKIFEKTEITREKLVLQLCHGLAPVCIGLTWILGAMEGLADPLFTCFVAGICGLWGVVEWKWGKGYA